MLLVGMPDSPYVRRVAVSLKLMGLPFEHQAVSVFRHFDRFHAINPVVKAPTPVADDSVIEGHDKPYVVYRSDDGRLAGVEEQPRRASGTNHH